MKLNAHPPIRRRGGTLAALAATALVAGLGLVATPAAADTVVLEADFSSGSWEPLRPSGDPQLSVVDVDGDNALLVAGRTADFHGVETPPQTFTPGTTYTLSVDLRLADGVGEGSARIVSFPGYGWIGNTTITDDDWTTVTGQWTVPGDTTADEARIFIGTGDIAGLTSYDYYVDNLSVVAVTGEVQDLLPIQDTVDFPLGVAIDQRETEGPAAELLTRHFNQITPENHMKPEEWYDAERQFRPHPQLAPMMEFAIENDLDVYGHVLVWHSQVPEWFFTDDEGVALTDSAEDRAVLRERMRTHIFNVAEHLATTYGLFGSDTNPLVAFDVVNEVITDDRIDDGLRRSEWFRIMGPDYIDLAFADAEEAFNERWAAPGADRPVALFINDYNTEQGGKQDRYFQVVEGLLERDVPIDGVGHQFHVSLATSPAALDATLERFSALGLIQAVTELDVTVGTPVTDAKLVEQGHFYREAFQIFRDWSDELFCVTIWGLTDGRSWRSEQAPLVFTSLYAAKPAYHGIVDSDALPPRLRSAVVFADDVPLTTAGATDALWADLPRHAVGDVGDFQLRWTPTHLVVHVSVADDADEVELALGSGTTTVTRSGGAGSVVVDDGDGWSALVHLPATLAQGESHDFNITIGDESWSTDGVPGSLALVEELSVVDVLPAPAEPVTDGDIEAAWDDAESLTTAKVLTGDETAASADVRLLWHGTRLHVLAEVTDPAIDLTASNPWEQDSIELFVDLGNRKAGPYEATDSQIRINVDGALSFGTGDEAAQLERVEVATARADGGYVVEAAIELGEHGGAGTLQGFDVQVNDATEGLRTGVRTWADPTSLGYQSTSRWGVARLLAEDVVEPTPTPTVTPTPTPTPPTVPTPAPTVEPTPSAVDVYSTPGFHQVNGRWWHTTCEPYSQTIRCRTEIWASQVRVEGAGFVQTTGWTFNNLTYLPYMTRAQWAANPLGHTGEWTAADGRRWRTECDTAATGRGGCRSFAWVDHVASQQAGGTWRHERTSGWVLNNIVRFR